MQSSITLSQLPYTGFDYGEPYNSLYWLALLVWSMVIAWIIVRNKQKFTSLFSTLAKVFIIQPKVPTTSPSTQTPATAMSQNSAPKILEERVIRFDPLKDRQDVNMSHVLDAHQHNDSDTITTTTPILSHDMQNTQTSHGTTLQPEERKAWVRSLVEDELATSRIGQMPDEFSSEDFDLVDFDGINPDDFWKPRQITTKPSQERETHENAKVSTPQKQTPSQHSQMVSSVTMSKDTHTATRIQQTETQHLKKVYHDTLMLDASGELPRLVLQREEVTNY